MADTERLGKGFVQIYTGDGKGKTTAALGLCFRAAGHGMRCLVVQFIKGRREYGEMSVAEELGGRIRIVPKGRGHLISPKDPPPEDAEMAREALAYAREQMLSGEVEVLVLDEICMAVSFGLLSVQDVAALIDEKPEGLELVLTGRRAHPELVMKADLVTECLMIKHYNDRGLPARAGIEV